jgi:hypothetical protein
MGNLAMLVQFPARSDGLSLLQNVQTGSGPSTKEAREFFLALKRFRLETDHILPSRTEVKNEWSYNSTPRWLGQGKF